MKYVFNTLIATFLAGGALYAQSEQNEFKIGIFGINSTMYNQEDVDGCLVPYDQPFDGQGNPTSVLNELAADGFNIFSTYNPDEWTSFNQLERQLLCANSLGLNVEVSMKEWYHPTAHEYTLIGSNIYDDCSTLPIPCTNQFYRNRFRNNYNYFLENLFTQPLYKDIIWGYHIIEEGSYWHSHHYDVNCVGNTWDNPAYFNSVEVPPYNLNNALEHFGNALDQAGESNHKLVVMEANHGRSIQPNTIDHEGVYNPQDYLAQLSEDNSRHVFFDGSYTQFPKNGWLLQNYSNVFNTGPGNGNFHYLGKYESLNYEKSQMSQVHSVICAVSWDYPFESELNFYNPEKEQGNIFHYHTHEGIRNANHLWFQAYMSIIHGAEGVWFWDFSHIFGPNDEDIENKPKFFDETRGDRFERQYMPKYYKDYVGPLAKELRFLKNADVLSTDPSTIVATKKTEADKYCILPAATTYITDPTLPQDKKSENYGLRYTIRTNGDETYMIIANPLNVTVSTSLNFSSVAFQPVRDAYGVLVMFDDGVVAPSSSSYKVDRDGQVDLNTATVGKQHFVSINEGILDMTFGPLDVKVFKFISEETIDHENSWTEEWSNNGSGDISGHTFGANDDLYFLDYDGDGKDELFVVGGTSAGNEWMSLLDYDGSEWKWKWSNYGSTTTYPDLYACRHNLYPFDFNGDGVDEFLGIDAAGDILMFRFISGNWSKVCEFSNTSNAASIGFYSTFYTGDFEGMGRDKLFAVDPSTNKAAIFEMNEVTPGVYQAPKIWDNFNATHPIEPFLSDMRAGDFDGDGKTEIFGFSSWATLFHFDNSDWAWGYSTSGANNIGGWTYPFLSTDVVLAGNLDADSRDELFLLQTQTNASYATTLDLQANQNGWNWNWSANPYTTAPYIDNWPLYQAQGTNTRYFLANIQGDGRKELFCLRKFCNVQIASVYKSNGSTQNFKSERENGNVQGAVVESLLNSDVYLFPNPSNGREVHLRLTASFPKVISLKVYNSEGSVVESHNEDELYQLNTSHENVLELKGYARGIYQVLLFTSEGYVVNKSLVLN